MIEPAERSIGAGWPRIYRAVLSYLNIAPAVRISTAQLAGLPQDCEAWLSQFWERANNSKIKIPVYLALHPRSTMMAARCIARLPRLNARLSHQPDGELIAKSLNTVCLAKIFKLSDTGACVLDIPAVPQDYSLGSSKQTLRRKVKAAEKLGISCRQIHDRSEQIELVAILDRAIAVKSNPLYRERDSDHSYLVGSGLWTVAFAQSGEPLVIAVTPRDGEWALLQAFVSLGETQHRSDARYLLTKVVVERLAVEGVRHLVDTRSPSQLPNGLRHFQRMLGFRIKRIRVLQEI
jgi:hypothetical protein